MKIKNLALFFILLFVPSLGPSYWQDLHYETDIKDHKQEFFKWIAYHGLWDQYARIILTMSCSDADYIPKHPDAGKVFEGGGDPLSDDA
jgi:hypothetical protein